MDYSTLITQDVDVAKATAAGARSIVERELWDNGLNMSSHDCTCNTTVMAFETHYKHLLNLVTEQADDFAFARAMIDSSHITSHRWQQTERKLRNY